MNDLQTQVTDYLDYCQNQKRLDAKTLRRTGLTVPVLRYTQPNDVLEITIHRFKNYAISLPPSIPLLIPTCDSLHLTINIHS